VFPDGPSKYYLHKPLLCIPSIKYYGDNSSTDLSVKYFIY